MAPEIFKDANSIKVTKNVLLLQPCAEAWEAFFCEAVEDYLDGRACRRTWNIEYMNGWQWAKSAKANNKLA